MFAFASVLVSQVFATPVGWVARPAIHVNHAALTSPAGLSPRQVWRAYGFDKLNCDLKGHPWGDHHLCGYGQVIAIVDAYDNPNVEADLVVFSKQFGLPACSAANGCFLKATPQGMPQADEGWGLEIALDVEWAHAVAPGARILLVEARTSGLGDILGAIEYAVKQPGVHQVSMSWGAGEFPFVTAFDTYFQANGVSFFASSGDWGNGVIWPAVSPYVVGVGGTSLKVDSSGNVLSETAWSGSGGGISSYVIQPPYQANYGVPSNGKRGAPDVSYNADPASGFPIYDSFGFAGMKGWFQVGGTSAGAPQWAALMAIVNSRRASALSSASYGTGNSLYGAATGTYLSLNFRNIASGNNGACGSLCTAGAGYDFVTGLGSPLANNLIKYLQTHT